MGLTKKVRDDDYQPQLPKEGQDIGILIWLVDLGTQKDEWKGNEKKVPKIYFGFELPNQTKEFNEEEKPLMVSTIMNYFTSSKANFRKFMENWRAKKYKNGDTIDPTKAIGKPAQLGIGHNNSSNGKTYANIVSITQPMKGTKIPKEPFNEQLILSLDDFDLDVYLKLPEWIRNIIKESDEWENLNLASIVGDEEEEKSNNTPKKDDQPTEPEILEEEKGESFGDEDDDIPF